MRKNHWHQKSQVIIQHFYDFVWIHLTREPCETPDVRVQNRDFASPPAETETAAVRQKMTGNLRRKLTEQIGLDNRFPTKFFLRPVGCDGHGRVLPNEHEQLQIFFGKDSFPASRSCANRANCFSL